jgi:hypothetical protein
MMRGLTIDKARGNVIKVDRHKYVKIAYHGLTQLTKDERQAAYSLGTSRQRFDTDDYTTIDTLFSLAEAYLFMQIVDFKDLGTSDMLNGKPYKGIYRDIRGAVDLCHRDGSLKSAVAANPSKYIHKARCVHLLFLLHCPYPPSTSSSSVLLLCCPTLNTSASVNPFSSRFQYFRGMCAA